MPRLLTAQEVNEELEKLEGWTAKGDFISKTYGFKRFMEGIEFVNRVAAVAEKLEHHPDVSIRYTRITLSLQTHSAGGVTKWDLQLARAIDKLGGRAEKTVD